jgi:hypothetical protein
MNAIQGSRVRHELEGIRHQEVMDRGQCKWSWFAKDWSEVGLAAVWARNAGDAGDPAPWLIASVTAGSKMGKVPYAAAVELARQLTGMGMPVVMLRDPLEMGEREGIIMGIMSHRWRSMAELNSAILEVRDSEKFDFSVIKN